MKIYNFQASKEFVMKEMRSIQNQRSIDKEIPDVEIIDNKNVYLHCLAPYMSASPLFQNELY